jgi:hypothetical protein
LMAGSTATAGPRDASSSERFVALTTTLLRGAITQDPRERAGIDAVVSRVARRCPGTLPGYLRIGSARQQRVWTAFALDEPGAEFAIAILGPLRRRARTWVHSVEDLRWSDAAINRAVTTAVDRLRRALALRSPGLCRGVSESAASGFTTVPPATARFLKLAARALPPESFLEGGRLARRMRAFVPASGQAALKRLRALQARVDRNDGLFVLSAFDRLVRALRGS